MINYLNWSVEELFKRAASPEPEPGGGGASAMTGCLGISMLVMVARITEAKEKDPVTKETLLSIIASLEKNMLALQSLAQKDMEAFNNFMKVLSLPRNTSEEKTLREEKKQQAALLSANIPLEMAKGCMAGLQAAVSLASSGSKYAISDVGVGVHLLEAALKGALLMVEANLPYINVPDTVQKLRHECELLIVEAGRLSCDTLDTVRKRM
ncbi:Formimidoyltetrahydrofolate cyclodeaminase [Desulforamulus reducens MI-1]|uniref:Formimidoyltetrahydrofolate cyclodeaminase n=1 Tax=Desulforamulus reducens (strain ATCC BAA-1160 / DSM 100696 / MI-1) TaxID=349161 RepID=A4J3F6_DESRM|nr:cyclodeaminase/cyclohydrolase family protein [Desulforamulus reducens]ABO49609.1 Formimidoyltetrahydrofolate cyclodeaminase [Desulforamulus reducens MI-1]